MALYSFGYFSQGFPIVFSGPPQPDASVLPSSRRFPAGIMRFANRRPWELNSHIASNTAQAGRMNGVVVTRQRPADSMISSGVVVAKHCSMHIYGKTPSSVLATEGRNTNVFGQVIFK